MKPSDRLAVSPEIRSYIYQAMLDFEPFATPNTAIHVVSKNPLNLLTDVPDDLKNTTFSFDRKKLPPENVLSKMYRIGISLTEGDQQIESESLHEDIYEAIRLAKDHLVKTLSQIQDAAISHQDRLAQIQSVLAIQANQWLH